MILYLATKRNFGLRAPKRAGKIEVKMEYMNRKTGDWEKKTRDTKENWCQFRVKKLTFRALALRQSDIALTKG